MIGRLRGVLAEVEADHALLDVGGVGYIVRMGSHALSRLPAVGAELQLHIESRTAEDGTTLYGFALREERGAFNALTAIQGVGPKAAMGVLDVLPPAELAAAVAREDRAAVGRAQGVGPKLALRIVTELKGKPLGGGLVGHAPPSASPSAPPPTATGEAVAALMGLGLAEPLARRAVETAAARLGPEPELAALIKAALQETAR